MTVLDELKNTPIEWKPLGEVVVRTRGTAITAGKMKNLDTENGEIKIFAGGKTVAYVNPGDIPEQDVHSIPSIIVKSRGNIGFEYYEKPFSHKNEMWSYHSEDADVNIKYIYYYLKNNELHFQKIASVMQMPQISIPDTEKYKIPIPPLDIQKQIVDILDKMTTITAELAAELAARTKQYAYYRNDLLSEATLARLTAELGETGDSVRNVTLGEIGKNLDSLRKPITSGNREAGDYPYYGASGIVDYVKDYIFDGEYLLISEDGANLLARNTPIAFSIYGKNWVNNHAHILEFNNNETRKFVEYYLNMIDLTPYISGAAQPKLNQANLNSITIPLPPLTVQNHIVSILDRFNALTTDLTNGLPAEIALRQKQYEYYRDQLLSFDQAVTTTD